MPRLPCGPEGRQADLDVWRESWRRNFLLPHSSATLELGAGEVSSGSAWSLSQPRTSRSTTQRRPLRSPRRCQWTPVNSRLELTRNLFRRPASLEGWLCRTKAITARLSLAGRIHEAKEAFQHLVVLSTCLLVVHQTAVDKSLPVPNFAALKPRLKALLKDQNLGLHSLATELAASIAGGVDASAAEESLSQALKQMLARGSPGLKALSNGLSKVTFCGGVDQYGALSTAGGCQRTDTRCEDTRRRLGYLRRCCSRCCLARSCRTPTCKRHWRVTARGF